MFLRKETGTVTKTIRVLVHLHFMERSHNSWFHFTNLKKFMRLEDFEIEEPGTTITTPTNAKVIDPIPDDR